MIILINLPSVYSIYKYVIDNIFFLNCMEISCIIDMYIHAV